MKHNVCLRSLGLPLAVLLLSALAGRAQLLEVNQRVFGMD
jgi:hypothetical protein